MTIEVEKDLYSVKAHCNVTEREIVIRHAPNAPSVYIEIRTARDEGHDILNISLDKEDFIDMVMELFKNDD